MLKGVLGHCVAICAPIKQEQIDECLEYIGKEVDKYLKNGGDSISVRILFGGANRDWHGTPLQIIYESLKKRYLENGLSSEHADSKAYRVAAQDVGKLLKAVVIKDKERVFECIENRPGKIYKLAGDAGNGSRSTM